MFVLFFLSLLSEANNSRALLTVTADYVEVRRLRTAFSNISFCQTPTQSVNNNSYELKRLDQIPMDPMDTIGETFYPLIQHRLTFSKSPTNRTWTFSIRIASVRWIRWIPSELLSTPLSNIG